MAQEAPQSLNQLIKILHQKFAGTSVDVDEIKSIMQSYVSNKEDWKKYALFDQYRYTRNLVDEGNGKFNLIVLCWGEGHGSSIHDHANSHCFMKMLQGELKETLFDWPKGDQKEMVKLSEKTVRENEVAYICDKIGLHRVENASHTEGSVSLHLYSPPFQFCQTFDQRTGHINKVEMTFTSKFGERQGQGEPAPHENN